jgi:hypothetical protein
MVTIAALAPEQRTAAVPIFDFQSSRGGGQFDKEASQNARLLHRGFS